MKALQNMQSTAGKRQLLFKFLPVLATAFLLFWLSGGSSPTSWGSLLQVLLQFQTLWLTQGSTLLLSLFILLIQSLLLAIAWGAILWLLIREGNKLLTVLFEDDITSTIQLQQPALQQKSTPYPDQAHRQIQPAKGVTTFEQPQQPIMPSPQAQTSSAPPDREASLEEVLGNPFAEPLGSRPLELTNRGRSGWFAFLRERPVVRKNDERRFFSSNSGSQELLGEQPVQEDWGQSTGEENFPALLANELYALSEEQIRTLEEKEASQNTLLENPFDEATTLTQAPASSHVVADPFDIKQEVLDIFAATNRPIEPAEKRNRLGTLSDLTTELTQRHEIADGEFVYGHPFEGPLPAVFQHDEELKRSVLAQMIEEEEQELKKRKKS